MILDFTVPVHPPSVNDMFATVRGRRIKSKAYRQFEIYIKLMLAQTGRLEALQAMPMARYRLELNFYSPDWICKNGRPKVQDHCNMIKAFEDAICAVLGWEDRYNFETVTRKLPGTSIASQAIFSPIP